MKQRALLFLLISALCSGALAQEANPTATQQWPQDQQKQYPQPEMRDGVPVYKVQVVGRDIPAVNYFHRSGSTKIAFQGTSLLPEAKGSAVVESRRGRLVINAKFEGLRPANSFGVEYLTYVLWAITPEGRPSNLGEILPQGSKNEIEVTTPLQAFGLIITAEPYYAVTMPSDVVVMQNFVLNDKTQGIIEQVNAHYSLLPRGAYTQTAGQHAVLNPITRNEAWPLELYEAINAVQIAEASGADKYASDTLATAKQSLQNAQDLEDHKSRQKELITYARAAVQTAEDARIMTIRKKRAEDEANTKQQAQDAQLAAAQAQAAADQQAAERARAEARAAEAEAQAAHAHQQTQQANDQTEQIRERLKAQLNQVLATRESARGLIVNMSDVLFDFNKYTLKPEAREKLAKVSGILLAYPGLTLQVEGYTDNIGSDEYNQKLSEERADVVRDYLVSQGVAQTGLTATGYGKNDPIADNSTNDGRAQNRRVQMVVSGSSIGVQEQPPSSPGNAALPATNNPPTAQNSGVSNPPEQQ
ncbi:OmpA family protein [Alloacidobacterium dinghuense]|uniref:OmpA family protein n=1 Tax=Alloacidobacterium dinghuense TaxID=2763107 RepID=A0A7G8BIZ1_9BACT|nr:OmpA family protein [Alloacidobacterium dinghuense]QNI32511.1 OmpA family protein [Alloacidobacterium dinghuense]